MKMVGRMEYENSYYTHQGWLTEDHKYVIANDELDEIQTKEKRTRTLVWDYTSLSKPELLGFRFSADGVNSVDHNLYIKGNYIYLANYCSGLRVYELSTGFPVSGDSALTDALPQVAYFDTAPYCDYSGNKPVFQGSWSSYPYFEGSHIIVSNIETGLFVIDITLPDVAVAGNSTVGH